MKNLLLILFLSFLTFSGWSQVTVENDPSLEYQKDLAERTHFEKINFSIQSPLHFIVPDTGFIGFIHPGAGGSIAIAEIPYRSSTNVADEFANKDFTATNSKLISNEKIVLNSGIEGNLFKVHFAIQDQLVERLVMIIGTDKKTYMVFANYPAMISPVLYPVILNSFKTALFEE